MKLIIVLGAALIICSLIVFMKINTLSLAQDQKVLSHTFIKGMRILFYIFSGDKVDLKYSFKGIKSWNVYVRFVKLSTGESWSYSDSGSVSEPVTPLFIAPESGVYLATISFNVTPLEGFKPMVFLSYAVKPSDVNSRLAYFIPKLSILLTLGIILIIIGLIVKLKRIPRFLKLISWEFYGFWKIWFSLIITASLMFLLLPFVCFSEHWSLISEKLKIPFPSVYRDPLGSLLDRVITYVPHTLGGVSTFWYVYYIYVVITCVFTFSYEVERKIIRDYLSIGISRIELYLAKLTTCIILSLLPLILIHLILMSIADFDLVLSMPLRFLRILCIRLMLDLGITIIALTYTLPPALFISRSPYALLIALLAPLILRAIIPSLHAYSPERLLTLYDITCLIPYLIVFPTVLLLGYIFMRFRDYA